MHVIIEIKSGFVKEVHLCHLPETAYKTIREITVANGLEVLPEEEISDPEAYYSQLYEELKEWTEMTGRDYYWGEHDIHPDETIASSEYFHQSDLNPEGNV